MVRAQAHNLNHNIDQSHTAMKILAVEPIRNTETGEKDDRSRMTAALTRAGICIAETW